MLKDFSFPYEPYPIQLRFMTELYDTLLNGKGGLFESPTGTGKTLSIICSSLTYLYDKHNTLLESLDTSSDPRKKLCIRESLVPPLLSIKQRISAISSDPNNKFQILYLTRTHSQLDQFTSELKKTKWGNLNLIRVIRLASRSQLCTNPKVNQEKALIDYACKSLIGKSVENSESEDENKVEEKKSKNLFGFYKKANKKISRCSYLGGKRSVGDEVLNRICDIEDLVRVGEALNGCPYYATRERLNEADIVLAPYSSILNKHNRNLIGLDLSRCHIIIDESHNLIQAIIDSHSASMTKAQILSCLSCFEVYRSTYVKKMIPRKLMYVDFSIRILNAIRLFMQQHERSQSHTEERHSFITNFHLDTLNFFEIWDFYEESLLPQKVFNIGPKSPQQSRLDLNALKSFQEFILTLNEKNGELILSKDQSNEFTIKFLLLNPYKKFRILLNEALTVVLAGGTLSPLQEFQQFFSKVPKEQFKNFSCDHIVPSDQLIVSCIGRTASNLELKFVYENRENPTIFNELGNILYEICCIVPNGVVAFVPSFSFLTSLQQMLCETAIPRISQKKEVFFDSRDQNILKAFSEAAENRGAILFAVVRGSLSEGINFSDKLGRCVIIIGMPYLNKSDPEVQSKMKFYNKLKTYSGTQYYENACEVAINQSIGRAIRHIKDYAAIILIDNRHTNKLSRRPKWMYKSMVPNINYPTLITTLQNFFRNKN